MPPDVKRRPACQPDGAPKNLAEGFGSLVTIPANASTCPMACAVEHCPMVCPGTDPQPAARIASALERIAAVLENVHDSEFGQLRIWV